MADNTHAAGQLQGYMLQVRHMLFELISLDDIAVSVESLDDVAVQSPDGSVIAGQVKSVTSGYNPATDRSVVFWKTMYNWLNYVIDGSLMVDTTAFRMIIVSNHNLKAGDLITQFHKANTKEKAFQALNSAKLSLWGKDGELRSDVPDTYGIYLDVLFSADNEDNTVQIIEKFSLDIHENDYDEKLTKRFKGYPIPTEFADNLLEYMLGWVNNRVNDSIKQGLPAIIYSTDFRRILESQSRMYSQRNSIPVLSGEVDSNDARIEVESQDIYIQQLDWIEADYDTKLEAASDYLRTKAEATIRGDKGLFTPQSLQDYYDKIRRLWKNKREQALLMHSYSDVEKGKNLYAQTGEAVSLYHLEGSDTPSFFGSGTLQSLANEPREEPTIGWHPNYKALIKGGGQSE